MSTNRKINKGVPQCSKLSPSLFSFNIADMPRSTDLVMCICYADDLIVWASWVNIPDLEVRLNSYQYKQNEGLRITTDCHKMSSIDHLHAETEMPKAKERSELLSAQ